MPKPTQNRPEAPPEEEFDASENECGATMIDDGSATLDGPPPEGATVVMDTRNLRPPGRPSAKLEFTRGPKAGSEAPLGPGDTTLGRQNDNTIVVPDISVSRRHVTLRRAGAGYVLVDMGSGNGTFLNGVRVEGEAALKDGDVFVMGDTEIRFVEPQAAPAPAPVPRRPTTGGMPAARPAPRRPTTGGVPAARPGPRRPPAAVDPDDDPAMTGRLPIDRNAPQKRRKKMLLIVTAVVAVLVIGAVFVKQRQGAAIRAQQEAEEMARAAELEESMNQAIEAGKAASKAGDFRTSVNAFTAALSDAEQLGVDVRDVKNRLEYSKREVEAQERYGQLKDAIAAGELAKASDLLKGIPEDSFFSDKLPELRAAMKAKIPERLATAKGALASKDMELARQALADVEAADPGNAEVASLSKSLRGGGDVPRGPRPPKNEPPPPAEDPTERAVEAFKTGKLDEAIGMASACDDARCKSLADKLTSFREAYRNLEADGAAEKAATLLKGLPGGSSSPYMASISGKAANGLVKEGIKAMGAENYPKAFQAFYKALQIDPSNAVAEKHMRTIKQKAKEIFEQAYVTKTVDPEKARKDFEAVISMTASEDEINQKSKRHLKSLTGGN